jgi:very-short-patch-repair endonuclease
MAARAGKLYRDITPAEIAMEEAVATLGVPYRVQFPYYLWGVRFFPDFVLPTLKVIVEVDDPSHFRPEKIEADNQRTEELGALGWKVVRCTNKEALDDARGVLHGLLRTVRQYPVRPVCTLQAGLPQRVAKKKRRGEVRSARLQKGQAVPAPTSLTPKGSAKESPGQVLN